jgi:hypothetical protein
MLCYLRPRGLLLAVPGVAVLGGRSCCNIGRHSYRLQANSLLMSPTVSPICLLFGKISSEFSDEFPVDVSDDIHFCYNSTIFCYALSGEVSGETPVVCPASSTYCFDFVGEPFLLHRSKKRVFFLLPGSKRDTCQHGKYGLGNQIPREIPSTFPTSAPTKDSHNQQVRVLGF